MDALGSTFRAWRLAGRRALIPYVTAGYPTPAATPRVLDALVEAGADIIELGIPFSDPVADGPTIQRSSQRALEQGVTLDGVLEWLREFHTRHDTPVVLFTYLNPLLSHGIEHFSKRAREGGAHGVLVTDLPFGADAEMEVALGKELPLIRLIAPTTSHERAVEIARVAQGFVYYIARTGVTGASAALRQALGAEIRALRDASDVPIAVGFGISSPDQAAAVAGEADGVVVGSALIDALDRGGIDGMQTFVRSLRRAIDGV